MKTTLEIEDELYREAKVMAALTRRKMKDLVSEGLRLVIRGEKPVSSAGTRPGMKLPLISTSPAKNRVSSRRVYDLETEADLERL